MGLRAVVLSFGLLAIVTVFLFNSLPTESLLVEKLYSNGIYLVFRAVWDRIFFWIPIPIIYVIVLLMIFQLRKIYLKRLYYISVWKYILYSSIVVLAVFISSFYWMWGFNYKRVKPWGTLDIPAVDISGDQILGEYRRVMDSMMVLRADLNHDDLRRYPSRSTLQKWSKDLGDSFCDLGFSVVSRPNVRVLRPRGMLLRFSTAGIYLPWSGEGHVDGGMHPITIPFTALHELAHAYGHTDEDMCNFWALLSGANSDDNFVRYSSYFAYWRYLRSALYQDKELFESVKDDIPEKILEDYKEILSYADRYPDLMPKVRYLFYDTYLKSHGVVDGIASYNNMIKRSFDWQAKYGHLKMYSRDKPND